MEETIGAVAVLVASTIEAIMVVVIAIGTIQAVYGTIRLIWAGASLGAQLRSTWLHYAAWIVLALEFALAADLIRTIVAPGWVEIGQLGAIAAIRTGLSWFLSRDFEEVEKEAPAEIL